MNAAPDFDRRRFQSAAAHYLAGRAPYPPALIARVVALAGLGPRDRLLDLGCGPAQLACAFAPFVGEVLALDPEPAMLALAEDAARGVPNVTVRAGRSDELGPELGRFRAVTIGRAFHWMDREDLLRRLETLLEPDGALVLFGDERPALPENAWTRDCEALLERYAEGDENRRWRKSEAYAPHLTVLLDSAFSNLERISVIWRRELDVETVIERALSQSSTSRARLGDRADAMVAELRAAAEGWRAGQGLSEVLASHALIARRGLGGGRRA